MADDFWKAVYDRLIDDIDLLKIICADTSNKELLSWIKPNARLRVLCTRFIRNGIIINREGLIDELIAYAKNDNPLRRIILLTWVEANQKSMEFFRIPGNDEAVKRLANGEFGDLAKIRILSRIEPRQGASKLYENVIKKLEEEQQKLREAQKDSESTPMFNISDAELEAAVHSREMIASPDFTNGSNYDGNFNEVICEELQKIKAALEILQDVNRQLKEENKVLRAEKGKRHTEISNYSSKLEKSVKESNKLKQEVSQLKDANSRLKTQLDTAKKEISSIPAPALSESEINDLRFKLDEALKENQKLKQVVANRDSSLSRIKAENMELHLKSDAVTGQSELIENLQQRISELQQKTEIKTTDVAGQIITKTRFPAEAGERAGKKCWLLVSLTGQVYYINLADIPANRVVPEEYVIVSFDNEKVVSIKSLDSEKQEVYGFIKSGKDNTGILVCEEYGDLPIMQEITEKWADRPARGIYLPELDNRAAGVYKIEILPNTANIKKTETKNTKKNSEKAELHEDNKLFNGQKIAIFGGDRVGLEYEKALEKVGLNAKWFSGFSLLSEISLGFGKPDLMVVVTKQLSHALLRELNAYAEKHSIKVIYSTRRGVSSVLDICYKNL